MNKPSGINLNLLTLAVFAMITLSTAAAGDSVDVDTNNRYNPMIQPDDRINRFVQRTYSRYGILPKGFHRQPMETADLLEYLDTLSTLPISEEERYTLDGLRAYLSIDKGLYGFRDGKSDQDQYGLIINLDLSADLWGKFGNGVDPRMGGRGIIGPQMRGHIGNVSFYTSLDVWTEYIYDSLFAMSSYQPYDGLPHELYGLTRDSSHVRSSDVARYGVNYNAGRISLQAAMDYLRTGPAVYHPVTLSGQTPPIVYARAVFDLTYAEYQHAVGLLRSQKNKQKYLYTNRLSGVLFNKIFQWGINEVIIDGSSTNQQDDDPANQVRPDLRNQTHDWTWAYCIPFVPSLFVGHYLGDNDNGAISFDACLNWPQDFRFYGEFYIDDMSAPWTIFSDDFRNKWALTIGMQYFTVWNGMDISAGAEASRIEPWVYTHFYGGSHRYDHFNSCLGSNAGPNSLSAIVNCDIGITKKITLGARITSLSNNTSVRGGKITDIFQFEGNENGNPPDAVTKRFLGPGTVSYVRPGVYGRYDPWGLFRVNAGVDVDVAEERGRVRFSLDGGFRF
jgi:hypothetical protein